MGFVRVHMHKPGSPSVGPPDKATRWHVGLGFLLAQVVCTTIWNLPVEAHLVQWMQRTFAIGNFATVGSLDLAL